ncbi:uncharacterized protein LOC131237010 [Magnolia sinica]|uniref:uncharacterized protein LOC131237010 n=1 Tax=Magnolia sinica TaxID=86752 RepID=UPI002657D244|nr:uncharacterized protein LOC131237010 [Magnolia sinica]
MGKKATVEKKKKKKKGRPSLLELQKRQQQLEKRSPNPNSGNSDPNPTRRSTRRNPNPDADRIEEESREEEEEEDDDDNGDELDGKRKEKKLKLVLKLPHRSSSPTVNSSGGSGGGSDGSDDSDGETSLKKRKINAVRGDGLDGLAGKKAVGHNSGLNATDPLPGTPPDSGLATPLPDKKLLVFILDRLQKKDTYGVFSEPVDPDELPDYHEVIENPMDFSTVRKKLSSGAYANLEQFKKDVFLISSNAMRYNANDTIYFRQARSIQELAQKSFENLKQDSKGSEPEQKAVRRGRPPGKSSIARSVGRPPSDRTGSDFSSDATLATAGDNALWSSSILDFSRNADLSDKFSITDLSARTSHMPSNSESYSWLADYRSERNEEFPGSLLKGMSKLGKKQFVLDDNRRSTYKNSHQSISRHEMSVLTTFDADRKQLTPVGLHMEHTYARSLARFAANLGPVAWKVALKKIEKSLPTGMRFGPGWVGEIEESRPRLPLRLASPLCQTLPLSSTPPQQPLSQSKIMLEPKDDKLSERQEPSNNPTLDAHLIRIHPPSASTSAVSNRSSNPAEGGEAVRRTSNESGFSLPAGVGGGAQPRPHFQLHQNPAIYPTLNGFRSFNLPSQVGKLTRPARPASNFGLEGSMPCGIIDMASRINNSSTHLTSMNHLQMDSKFSSNSNSVNAISSSLDSRHEGQTGSRVAQHPQPSWQGQSLHQKQDSVPPDLNVGFQPPGSPPSGVDSQQPDLALQL